MVPRLAPMLAVPATPFDSPEYNFEIKWDGIRALAAVDAAGWRLWGRQRADYTERYPELEVLRRLPAGTLVDGELVACDADGRSIPWGAKDLICYPGYKTTWGAGPLLVRRWHAWPQMVRAGIVAVVRAVQSERNG